MADLFPGAGPGHRTRARCRPVHAHRKTAARCLRVESAPTKSTDELTLLPEWPRVALWSVLETALPAAGDGPGGFRSAQTIARPSASGRRVRRNCREYRCQLLRYRSRSAGAIFRAEFAAPRSLPVSAWDLSEQGGQDSLLCRWRAARD